MIIDNSRQLRFWLTEHGSPTHFVMRPSFVFDDKEWATRFDELRKQHPQLSDDEAIARTAYRLLTHASKNQAPAQRKPINWKTLLAYVWGIVIVILLSVIAAKAGDAPIIQLKNQGTVLGTRPAGLVGFDCTTNMTCSFSNGVFSMTASSSASTNWSALAAGTNANAGSFIGSTNSWDFTGATIFLLRKAAACTTSADGDACYDTTNKRWKIWQNGTDKLLIASTNVGASGQAFLSNADGSGSFADPIVSGPDAPGAASTKNPVQVGCNFFTTPSTLANNNVGQIQCDSVQNVLVNLKTPIPAGSNVIGHVIADSGSTTAVTSLPANASINVAQLAGTATSVNSGTKDAGTQRVVLATDQPALTNALKVDGSAVTQPVSGTVTTSPPSNASTNVAQLAGTATDTNSGNKSAGTLRVVIATDQPAMSNAQPVNATLQAGSALAGEIVPVTTATTTDTALRCTLASAASTNSTNCKNAAGNVYGYRFINTTTTVYYLRMYNSSSAPTCSSSTGFIESIPIPPAGAAGGAGGIVSMEPFGEAYSTGISFCFTGGSSSTDNTNAATGVFGTILYK